MADCAETDELRMKLDTALNIVAKEQAERDSSSDDSSRQVENADRKEYNGRGDSKGMNGHTANGDAHDDPKTTAKFLVSNQAAGSIIGKGGANINELQRKAGAKLQLSRTSEFFPGTPERVLTVSGYVSQITAILTLILTSCLNDAEQDEQADTRLKFLAPSAVCGVLIGKAGLNIKSITKDSGSSITVSALHDQLPGVSDRIVSISGEVDEVVSAVGLILTKLQESKNYNRLASVPVNYQSGGMGWRGQGLPMAIPPHNPMAPGPPPLQGGDPNMEAEIQLAIPDARIGAIIGKGGEIISQIKSLLEVGIRISDRDSFLPGTRDREITIRGLPQKVHLANQLIHERLNAPDLSTSPVTGRRRL